MRITAFAKGLFSLVDSLEMGKGLSELSDTMAATVEMSDLLGMSKLKEEEVQVIGPSLTPLPLHTVPSDKVWRVRAWGAALVTGAGETTAGCVLGVRLTPTAPVNTYIAALSPPLAQGAGLTGYLTAVNLPIWLPPGANLCAFGLYAGGSPDWNSHVVFEEFDA